MTLSPVWGILGGGFGLYGYLPALAKSGVKSVLIEKRHRPTIERRPELLRYQDIVVWASAAEDIAARAESLVLAIPPAAQEVVVGSFPGSETYQQIVLEKPIATTPDASHAILRRAISSSEAVRVGYGFLNTPWAIRLKETLSVGGESTWSVQWRFLANHFSKSRHSWKLEHDAGGGALRFYGIHVIALLASIGEWTVEESRLISHADAPTSRWRAKFSLDDLVTVSVDVDSKSFESRFYIGRTSSVRETLIDVDNPFSGFVCSPDEDARVCVLQDLLETFAEPNTAFYQTYTRVNSLWEQVERATNQELS